MKEFIIYYIDSCISFVDINREERADYLKFEYLITYKIMAKSYMSHVSLI